MMDHINFNRERNSLFLLDQRFLPDHEDWFECRTVEDVVSALKEMVIRGAPAIGVCAAYGCYLAAAELGHSEQGDWPERLQSRLDYLARARPTAVNLSWAVDYMRGSWEKETLSLEDLKKLWLDKADSLLERDREINRRIGHFGQELLTDGDRVMTHCNAGALATAGYGTALGVIRGAWEAGKNVFVIANETRPFLQGSRLTAYELKQDDIPVRVACDNACGLLMRRGLVDKVVVGADRIAANGDVANKIGTYTVAVLAREHGIPFYVAAPRYSFDLKCPSGEEIPLEQRPEKEVTHVRETRIAPSGVGVYNFAFDITPAEYVSGFITEDGVVHPPFDFPGLWGK
jgi:methylthioribose-1-phosphate isomerase